MPIIHVRPQKCIMIVYTMIALLRFVWLGVRASGESGVSLLISHCKLLPVICDSIPFLDVVFCRSTYFINCCLNSASEIVNYVARHGVFFSRMRSPIGSNALHCCQRYGARANDISIINPDLINRYVRCRYSDELISRASALLELIFIRDHSFNVSGWDIQKINYMLSAICRE